jgi:hypothetical protein
MRILGSVVGAQTLLMASGKSELRFRSTVGSQLVGHQHLGCEALLLQQFAHQLNAAVALRRRCTSKSRTSPSLSTRQSQNCLPPIITAISSRCHCEVGGGDGGELLSKQRSELQHPTV